MIITAMIIILVSNTEPLKSTSSNAKEILVIKAIINVGRAIARLGIILSLISDPISRFASEKPKSKLKSFNDSCTKSVSVTVAIPSELSLIKRGLLYPLSSFQDLINSGVICFAPN